MSAFAPKQKQAPQRTSSTTASPKAPAHSVNHQEHPILNLQRTIGNQAVLRRLQAEAEGSEADAAAGHSRFSYNFASIPVFHTPVRGIQRKLTVNEPGDAYEQEADRVADQVMRMPAPQTATADGTSAASVGSAAGIQRACACGGTCDDCKKEHPESDHARVQMKAAGPANAGGIEAPPIVHEVLRSPGQPLDAATRAFMEPRFGWDFNKVRVHTDERAAESARAVQARAYTVGSNVVFGAGAFETGAEGGQQLLAHELAHVVQQAVASSIQRTPDKKKSTTPIKRHSRDLNGNSGLKLERVGDAWHLTIPGFTAAVALGVYLWPSGPPRAVQIAPLVIIEEPAPMGIFELTGITSDALDTMDPSFAKWFFDMGLRPEHHTLHTIRIWFKAFIPQAELYGPPLYNCFKGDNRTYSGDRMAPARMHSEVVLENLETAAPTMSQTHRCGLTREVDCHSGTLIESGTADTSDMRFYNLRYPGAVVWDWDKPYPPAAHPPEITVGASAPVSVDYSGAAPNPLVPVAPLIDMWAHIEFDQKTGLLTVDGKVDDFPAFEGYVTVNDQAGPFNLFALDGDDWVLSLIGGANRPFRRTISLGSYVAK